MLIKKNNCITCGREVGLKGQKVKAGTLCSDCGKIIVAKFGWKSIKMDKEDLQRFIDERNQKIERYGPYEIASAAKGNTEQVAEPIIQFRGVVDKKKAEVSFDGNELRVAITTLFKQEVQKSAITNVIISNYKNAGVVRSGFVELRFPVRRNIRTFKIEYRFNEQQQVELLINEINSYIREVKVTCKQCGKIHFFDESDVKDAQLAAKANLGKALIGLGLFLPLAFLPDENIQELKRCRSCGSRNVDLEEQAHKKNG